MIARVIPVYQKFGQVCVRRNTLPCVLLAAAAGDAFVPLLPLL